MKSNETERADFVLLGSYPPREAAKFWSDFTKRELPFALNPEGLLPSPGRRLSSISVWTQRELMKSLRFTTIFLRMDCRIITHLSFVSIATSNPSMKAAAPTRCSGSRGIILDCQSTNASSEFFHHVRREIRVLLNEKMEPPLIDWR